MQSDTAGKIRVAILEDHQSIVDGYIYRLGKGSQFEVAGVARYGSELEPLLANKLVDILFLDVNVPTAPDNNNPYPILHVIPQLVQQYPNLAILVISMLAERALIRAVMDAGADGYILKDDQAAIEGLDSVVISVLKGGIYLSQQASDHLFKRQQRDTGSILTPRQLEALSLCAAYPEWSRSDLASHLSVSHSTARNLLSGAYLRLGVRNLPAAIIKARQLGLITPIPPTS
jgi:DNA-binding NarL/FixJ family response regulator